MTPLHLARWAAAIEGWHRINFDQTFAVEHDGLPSLVVNGSWKRQFLAQYLMRILGREGWLILFECQFRRMSVAGETITAWAVVTDVLAGEDYSQIVMDVGIRNVSDGEETSPGTARGVLPNRPGQTVPYPWPRVPCLP